MPGPASSSKGGASAQRRFYEDAYAPSPHGELYARWRTLGAQAKASHVERLLAEAGLHPETTLDVGCGDGVLLAELAERRIGRSLSGVELSQAAVAIARSRELAGIEEIVSFDGSRLPFDDASFDLAVLSHVLEHVPDPVGLLTESARVARAVIVEVPLEANAAARREAARGKSTAAGHLRRLDRAEVRRSVEDAALEIAAELTDPLTLRVQLFFADTPAARARALVKAAVRRTVYAVSPRLAERLFTVHYACLVLRP